jgi:hypothetical protein
VAADRREEGEHDVCRKAIGPSLSPVIHNAWFAAAGLTGWSYTAIECAEPELPGLGRRPRSGVQACRERSVVLHRNGQDARWRTAGKVMIGP